jgi:hypothetical protein
MEEGMWRRFEDTSSRNQECAAGCAALWNTCCTRRVWQQVNYSVTPWDEMPFLTASFKNCCSHCVYICVCVKTSSQQHILHKPVLLLLLLLL